MIIIIPTKLKGIDFQMKYKDRGSNQICSASRRKLDYNNYILEKHCNHCSTEYFLKYEIPCIIKFYRYFIIYSFGTVPFSSLIRNWVKGEGG